MVNVKYDKSSFIVLQGEEKDIRVNEGDAVQFVVENTDGQTVVGTVTKIAGSKKERKLQILPMGGQCEELWSIFSIAENTFKVTKRVNEFEEDADNEDKE